MNDQSRKHEYPLQLLFVEKQKQTWRRQHWLADADTHQLLASISQGSVNESDLVKVLVDIKNIAFETVERAITKTSNGFILKA